MKNTVRIIALALVAVMVSLALVSCGGPNADPDKAEEALKKNGYEVSKLSADQIGVSDIEGVTDGIFGLKMSLKDDDNGIIFILYFESSAKASDAWDKIKDKANETLKDQKDTVCEKSGKMIYFGTKNAVKAAK